MRMELLSTVSEYAGRYFSMEYIKKTILQMTDKEIRDMQKQIDAEVKDEKIVKDATIEWGAMGPQPPMPPEEEEVPPAAPAVPPAAPAVPPVNGQPQEEEQLNEAINLNITEILKSVHKA